MLKQFILQKELFGKGIIAQISRLDSGLHILLVGGEKTHVGAVAMSCDGKLTHSCVYPSHKEQVICDKWAECLSSELHDTVTVVSGIHYDNATREQIQMILNITDDMLKDILQELKNKSCLTAAEKREK